MKENLTREDLPQHEETDVPIDYLHVDGDNPNEQNDATFGNLIDGIRSKGWVGGKIVANTGELPGWDGGPEGLICDGEHRWRAAQEVGLDEVPVKLVDFEDDADRRYWRQHLNKTTGDHDTKRDGLEYDYLMHHGMAAEVQSLTEAAGEDLDEVLATIRLQGEKPVEYEYDPSHNVYFEDCVEGMRDRLDDDSVDCVITDPPYGLDVDMQGGLECVNNVRDKGSVDNDHDLEESIELFDDVLSEIRRVLTDDGHLYVFASWKTYPDFATLLTDRGYEIRNCLIWRKKNKNHTPGFSGDKPLYGYNHEFCLFAVSGGGRRLTEPQEDVLEYPEARFDDVTTTETPHPTQKPVSLTSRFVELSTDEGDVVLDPFMGSGTTAVAAIQNNRDYIGFEIDEENYRSVIERRIAEAKRQVNSPQNADADADDAAADD